jgi:hypothetical protein
VKRGPGPQQNAPAFEIGGGREPGRMEYNFNCSTAPTSSGNCVSAEAQGADFFFEIGAQADVEVHDNLGAWAHEANATEDTHLEIVYDDPSDLSRWWYCSYDIPVFSIAAAQTCNHWQTFTAQLDGTTTPLYISPIMKNATGYATASGTFGNVDHGVHPANNRATVTHLSVEVQTAPDNGAGAQSYAFTVLDEDQTDLGVTCAISEGATTCTDVANLGVIDALSKTVLQVVSTNTPAATDVGVAWCTGTGDQAAGPTINAEGQYELWHRLGVGAEDGALDTSGQYAIDTIGASGGITTIHNSSLFSIDDGQALQVIGYITEGFDSATRLVQLGYVQIACNEVVLTGTTTPWVESVTASDPTFNATESRRMNGGVIDNTGAGADIVLQIEDTYEIRQGQSVTLVNSVGGGTDIEFCFGAKNRLLGDKGSSTDDLGYKQTTGTIGDFVQFYAEEDGDLRVLGERGTWTEQACSL